jgi:hypothetical protein
LGKFPIRRRRGKVGHAGQEAVHRAALVINRDKGRNLRLPRAGPRDKGGAFVNEVFYLIVGRVEVIPEKHNSPGGTFVQEQTHIGRRTAPPVNAGDDDLGGKAAVVQGRGNSRRPFAAFLKNNGLGRSCPGNGNFGSGFGGGGLSNKGFGSGGRGFGDPARSSGTGEDKQGQKRDIKTSHYRLLYRIGAGFEEEEE